MVSLNTLNIVQRNNESYSAYSNSQKQQNIAADGGSSRRYLETSSTVERNGELEKSTYVEISYESAAGKRSISASSVEKYQAIGKSQSPADSTSANILKFIETQLARDLSAGASNEELRERLQSGVKGFEKGFSEGLQQVKSLGWDTPEVSAGLAETFDRVATGLALLADKYGIDEAEVSLEQKPELDQGAPVEREQANNLIGEESQAAEVIESLQNVAELDGGIQQQPSQIASEAVARESRSINSLSSRLEGASKASSDARLVEAALAQQSESRAYRADDTSTSDVSVASIAAYRSYEFEVKTADGDVVTVSAYSEFAQAAAESGGEVGLTGYNEDFFNFSVEGELDDAELAAINDLISQVNDVAELFFNGDVYAAYEEALEIGFNDPELVQFSLNLEQAQVTQVEEVYREVQEMSGPEKSAEQSRINVVSEFINKLNILDQGLQHLGLNFQVAHDMFTMLDKSSAEVPGNNHQLSELAERLGPLGTPREE